MRIRLFLAFSLVTVISIGLLGYLVQTNTQTTITTFAQSGGFVGADRVAAELSDYYTLNGSWQGVDGYIATLAQGENQNATEHSGGQGQGMGMGGGNRYGAGSGMGMGGVENFTLVDVSGTVIYTQNSELPAQFSQTALENAIPVTVDEQTIGYLIPDNALVDLSGVISENLAQALGSSFFTTVMISSGVALVLAFVFAYVLMRPIRQLTTAARKLGEGDLSQRVHVGGSSEIKQMANTFNQMAESLQKANQARKSMTADIAHELRNPLAVQRANLEALQDGLYPMDVENLEPILQQNKLLTQLVEDLRTLEMADAEKIYLDLQPVNISAVVGEAMELFERQYEQNGIELVSTSDREPENLKLNLDRKRITQIISNLLHNALRHTSEGGRVTVTQRTTPKAVTITIQDTGEGIPSEALPLIFDRFYRADQSRARDKGGSGLGLTIARRLAEAHGGTLTAANAPEGGAVFTLTLPREEITHDYHK